MITGKAVALYDDKFATMTQSFGPEARGGACQSQLIISGSRVLYPYCTTAGVLIALSQEAYDKYEPDLADGGILIIEEELVKPSGDAVAGQAVPHPRDAFRRSSWATACSPISSCWAFSRPSPARHRPRR